MDDCNFCEICDGRGLIEELRRCLILLRDEMILVRCLACSGLGYLNFEKEIMCEKIK